MRAMLLWEGVYRYGGMPIVREVIDPTDFSHVQGTASQIALIQSLLIVIVQHNICQILYR